MTTGALSESGHNMQVARRMVRACLLRDIPAFVWGPAGVGKSTLLGDEAAALDWPRVDITLSTMDPTDLQGMGFVADGGLHWAKPTWLVELESYGDRETLLTIDEMNAGTSQAMLAAALKLILNRRAGSHPLPAKCRIVAAGNRVIDRAGVTKLTGPMANRFSHIFVVPDNAAFQTWANLNKVEPILCAFLNHREKRGESSLHVPGDGSDVAWPSPRSWVQASRFCDEPDDVRVHLFASQVGLAQATEFDGFVRLWRSLPSVECILADPRGATLPTETSMAFAISGVLSRAATRANLDAIITYMQRVGATVSREFETLAVLDAIKRDASLKETSAFVAWAARNADALT